MIGFGVRVVESAAAYELVRVRKYPKRRAKSLAHWRRMDKKWLRRYGNRADPRVFQMGDVLIVHPSLMPELRRSVKEVQLNAVGSFGL